MGTVTVDVITRGLDEAIMNVKNANNLITAGTYSAMVEWYNQNMKLTMLRIIDTGEGVAKNVGQYAMKKERQYGISHGLGRLTGTLYMAVESTQPTIKETRGKEVRLAVQFDDPYYLMYVVDGTSKHVGRDFIMLAKDKELPNLTKMIGTIFDGLDFTQPYPVLLSTVISHYGGSVRMVR